MSRINMPIKDLKNQAGQSEIVTVAVFAIGGGGKIVDTEDVAIEAHRIAPSRFSWKKYPDQINIELVRVFLSDARKPGRAWISGSGNKGWTLTPAGLEWARANAARITGAVHERKREDMRGGSATERRWRRERARILSLVAWRNWANGESHMTPRDACEVFRIDSYAVGRLRELKVTRMLEMFEADAEIRQFLTKASEAVSQKGEDECQTLK